ncbi:MAG: RsmB/NOP family class I SAM-dependent RNA methyltransferase [Candidatus Omnitrophica bacterium]|nr:RsmB/NOP family class I SAM-dependent RNA methyltransferase [Candidatus Omnitrophota bacterium]
MHKSSHSLPPLFLDRLREIFPRGRYEASVRLFASERPLTFRANRLKETPERLREELKSQGFHLGRVSWYPDAFILPQELTRDLQRAPAYQEGRLYIQGLSSMVPALILDPKPGEDVLDLTAAPGSKTTQLAALMGGEGGILANDNNRVRFFKLKANVELMGARNVSLMCAYGEGLGRKFPGRFDRVLVDAPCSAEGRFDTNEPRTYRFWKPAKVREMARKQTRLLFSGLKALKAGGRLVYSTCTYAPEENEGVLDKVITRMNGEVELEDLKLPFPNWMRGLKGWEGKTFHPTVEKAVRILPTHEMEGFFIAAFRRNPSN